MNRQFLLQEFLDLKRKFWEQKGNDKSLLYNQMLIAKSAGAEDLKQIILGDWGNLDQIRTKATPLLGGFTSEDGEAKDLITNDYVLTLSAGDFTVYTKKDSQNLNIQVFVSNEMNGELWVEAEQTETKEVGDLIQEAFEISKGVGNRLRLKFVLSKTDALESGTMQEFNVIYQ